MTVIALNGQGFGSSLPVWGGPPSYLSTALSSATAGAGIVFEARDTNPITHVGLRFGAVTGTPPTYRVSLQGVDADGLPDGNVLASVNVTPDGTWANSARWLALDASYTAALGEVIAAAIQYVSGTVSVLNNIAVTHGAQNMLNQLTTAFPYPVTAGLGAFQTVNRAPLYGVRTATTRYGTIFSNQYDTGVSTVGRRQAMKFTLPSGFAGARAVGLRGVALNWSVAAKTFGFGLWDAAGNPLVSTRTLDSDHTQSTSGTTFGLLLAAAYDLAPGTPYYFGFECLTADNPIGLRGWQMIDSGDWRLHALGQSVGYSTWDGAAWVDDDTVRPHAEIVLESMTVGGVGLVGTGRGLVG